MRPLNNATIRPSRVSRFPQADGNRRQFGLRLVGLACQTLEAAFVLGVALLSLAYEARKLLNWIDARQRKRRLDEASVVALAPAAKPAHHG
jgi:hypothetical protein